MQALVVLSERFPSEWLRSEISNGDYEDGALGTWAGAWRTTLPSCLVLKSFGQVHEGIGVFGFCAEKSTNHTLSIDQHQLGPVSDLNEPILHDFLFPHMGLESLHYDCSDLVFRTRQKRPILGGLNLLMFRSETLWRVVFRVD